MWLAHVCRHLFCDDFMYAKLHFLTGSQKNIFYQMTSGDFSMKKAAFFGRLAIISNEI
jgi:hypothetical protein